MEVRKGFGTMLVTLLVLTSVFFVFTLYSGSKHKGFIGSDFYYLALSSIDIDRKPVEQYVNIYLTYRDREIPEKEWKILQEMTDESYVPVLKDSFINKAETSELVEITDEEIYEPYVDPEIGEYVEPPEDWGKDQESEFGEQRKDELANLYYVFSKNKFVAEAVSTEGKYYMYFDINEEGKVSSIHA
jgi:hypothetical protein